MSEQTEQDLPDVPFPRYALAVLATAVTVIVAFSVAAGLTFLMYHFLGVWFNRQMWQLQVGLLCVFGVVLLILFGAAWTATTEVWGHFMHPRSTAEHNDGHFARRHPGRPADTLASESRYGRCPRCKFSHKWNGATCGHCRYGQQE